MTGAARLKIVRDFGPQLVPSRTLTGEWTLEQAGQLNHTWRVLALHGRKLVGSLCYEYVFGGVRSCGTFTSRRYRRFGIASRLWDEMLRRERPRRVWVLVASDRGLTLVESLKRRHPGVIWKVREGGDRKLRVRAA